MKKVLVICSGNSIRSQMAEGFLKFFTNGMAEIYSAGTTPKGLNHFTVQVMDETGIDVSLQTSDHIDKYSNIPFDYVITVCDDAKEKCPIFNQKTTTIHRSFQDPSLLKGSKEDILKEFRRVRDEIKSFCNEFSKNYLN